MLRAKIGCPDMYVWSKPARIKTETGYKLWAAEWAALEGSL